MSELKDLKREHKKLENITKKATKVRLNDCTMHHNGGIGLSASTGAVVDLHGTKTDIHSNKNNGIVADFNAKVNIHLPSQYIA